MTLWTPSIFTLHYKLNERKKKKKTKKNEKMNVKKEQKTEQKYLMHEILIEKSCYGSPHLTANGTFCSPIALSSAEKWITQSMRWSTTIFCSPCWISVGRRKKYRNKKYTDIINHRWLVMTIWIFTSRGVRIERAPLSRHFFIVSPWNPICLQICMGHSVKSLCLAW